MAVSRAAAQRGESPMTGHPLIGSDSVEGTAVMKPTGEKIGRIERVMIDKLSGHVAYAVMSFGGFFGMGERYFTLPWRKLDYDASLEGYVIDIDEKQLEKAPDYDEKGEIWTDRRREELLHRHYNVPPYWI